MIIIESNLSIEEGVEREKFWIKYYKEQTNYFVLNKTKGGEVGTDNFLKWAKEAVFEESKKYKHKCEFKKESNRAYKVALKNKWLDEMYWLVPYSKYTKEDVFRESKKYTSRNQFKQNSSLYQIALRNKWIDEMDWLITNKNN